MTSVHLIYLKQPLSALALQYEPSKGKLTSNAGHITAAANDVKTVAASTFYGLSTAEEVIIEGSITKECDNHIPVLQKKPGSSPMS